MDVFSAYQSGYFVVCYFWHETFNTTKLLNYVAPSVELIMTR